MYLVFISLKLCTVCSCSFLLVFSGTAGGVTFYYSMLRYLEIYLSFQRLPYFNLLYSFVCSSISYMSVRQLRYVNVCFCLAVSVNAPLLYQCRSLLLACFPQVFTCTDRNSWDKNGLCLHQFSLHKYLVDIFAYVSDNVSPPIHSFYPFIVKLCLSVYLCLSVCLSSTNPPINPSIHPSFHQSLSRSVCISLYLTIHRYVSLSIYPPIYQSIDRAVFPITYITSRRRNLKDSWRRHIRMTIGRFIWALWMACRRLDSLYLHSTGTLQK